MSSDFPIELSDIGKSYKIYHRPIDRIREMYSLGRRTYHANFQALADINLAIPKGQTVGIIGPNGSGKSTLLNLLSLIDRPSSGSLIIDNMQINFNETNKNDILRANKIGIIYQQDNLLTDFTALENIYLASLAGGYKKELSISKAKSLLKKVNSLSFIKIQKLKSKLLEQILIKILIYSLI